MKINFEHFGNAPQVQFLMRCLAIIDRYDGTYEDEVVQFQKFEHPGYYQIILKEAFNLTSHCDNPIVIIKFDGGILRWHGEAVHAFDHVEELYRRLSAADQPYLVSIQITAKRRYNPHYGDERECMCGHPYYRHFDSYEDNAAVGCKYCGCYTFQEKKEEDVQTIDS